MRLTLLLGLAAYLGYRSLFSGPLDGSSWDVRLASRWFWPFGGRETLVFRRGRFEAERLAAARLLPPHYDAMPGGGATPWRVSAPAADGGTLEWEGRVDGDRIRGSMLWRRADGSVRRYGFRGRRRK